MKLFNAIAAAAFVGTSFIAANSVEAQRAPNGWIQGGYFKEGGCNYLKTVSRDHPFVTVEIKDTSPSEKWEIEYRKYWHDKLIRISSTARGGDHVVANMQRGEQTAMIHPHHGVHTNGAVGRHGEIFCQELLERQI